MATAPAEVEAQKQAAAQRALDLVKPGTIVGLGTGSTARYFIERRAARSSPLVGGRSSAWRPAVHSRPTTATWCSTPALALSTRHSAWRSTRSRGSSSMDCSSAWPGPRSSAPRRAYEFSASCPELALCLGAEMAFEYRVVNTVEEASQLSEDG